jgi:hypothetical protein
MNDKMGYKKIKAYLFLWLFMVIIIWSCKTQNNECLALTNEEIINLKSAINKSIQCGDFTVLNCDILDKQYLYSTETFKKHYNKMFIDSKMILDSMEIIYKKAFDNDKKKSWEIGVPFNAAKKDLNGDSIAFLNNITFSILNTERAIIENFDTVFSELTFKYLDSSIRELKRSEVKMQHEFYDSLYISSTMFTLTENFSSNDRNRFPIIVNIQCESGEIVKVFIYKFDSKDQNRRFDIDIIGIK